MWQPERGQLQRQERKPSSGSAPRYGLSHDPWAPSSSDECQHLGLNWQHSDGTHYQAW